MLNYLLYIIGVTRWTYLTSHGAPSHNVVTAMQDKRSGNHVPMHTARQHWYHAMLRPYANGLVHLTRAACPCAPLAGALLPLCSISVQR